MPSDFIDRAKLEAEAADYADVGGSELDAEAQKAFLAGAATYAALLDAETTKEWGVRLVGPRSTIVLPAPNQRLAESYRPSPPDTKTVVSRKVTTLVTPWLPSEGGEKP